MTSRLGSLAACLLAFVMGAAGATDPAPTFLSVRGDLLHQENFEKPLPPLVGKPVGFASGFSGWRYNGSQKSGQWQVMDGTFRGAEGLESHHPATASYGFQFHNAVIQCDFRLEDVPAEGRPYRTVFIKATDAKDYVLAIMVGPGLISAVPYDAARINPATKQRDKASAARAPLSLKLGQWYTLVVEILGDEVVGSINGRSVTFSNPLVGAAKHSIMLGVGTEASFRNLRIWEARPNPDWEKHKASMAFPKP